MRRRSPRIAAALLICLLMGSLTVYLAAAQETTPEVTQEPPITNLQPAATATGSPTATPPPATAAPTNANDLIYTIRPGDTLFRIAVRFGTNVRALAEANGIVNPSLIYAGQQIRIPGVSGTPAPATATPAPVVSPMPTATSVPGSTSTYTVVRGDTLARIAIRFRTTVAQLVALNNIRNPNLIYVGQQLIVPGASAATPVPSPAASAGTGATTISATGTSAFAYGIEAYLVDQDVSALTDQIAELGIAWVKVDVSWRDFEPVKGEIDFATLDNIVDILRSTDMNILFTVSTSPEWARTSTDESGPPDSFADYGTFIGAMAQHYSGRVQAYEIWNEPNLRREWNSTVHSIGPTNYIELLRAGYTAVKGADPAAVVVSAGLAPTGFNDGVNAINDRVFLNGLYAAGLASVSDAIGVHPGGWANPPDAICCAAPVGVETHYQDRSFYFLNTLTDYRDIMVRNNDAGTALWVTRFGWGTSEDTDPPADNQIFVSYTSLGEQAIYVPRAFELGEAQGFIGPMFLSNLNGCQAQTGSAESCYYSLIGPDGSPRPVLAAVEAATRPDAEATPEPMPTATAETLPAPANAEATEEPSPVPTLSS